MAFSIVLSGYNFLKDKVLYYVEIEELFLEEILYTG